MKMNYYQKQQIKHIQEVELWFYAFAWIITGIALISIVKNVTLLVKALGQ